MNQPTVARLNESGGEFDRLLPPSKPRDKTTAPQDPRPPAGLHMVTTMGTERAQVKDAHRTGAVYDNDYTQQPKQTLVGVTATPASGPVTTRSL
jgi:hypothetical protein